MKAGLRLGAVVALLATGACAGSTPTSQTAPTCSGDERLGIVAQSVPDAAYVPCVGTLPPGWSFGELSVDDDGATFSLDSDRADQDVEVSLVSSCDVGSATLTTPRDEGVRTYERVESIDPRYAGRTIDVFDGGCVVIDYDFERGPHIALITELGQAVGLHARRQLRQDLREQLGITLDP